MPNQPDNPNQPEKQSQAKQYMKYSGIAFQMISVLLLALWGGQKLDEAMGMKNPIFTVVLLLLGVGGSMYLVIKGVTKKE